MPLSTQDQLLIESRVTNDGPNLVVAYLLWFALGLFSAHRFYLGRPKTAILQFLMFFLIVGMIWLFVDAFLIPGMVREKQQKLRERLTAEALAGPQPTVMLDSAGRALHHV